MGYRPKPGWVWNPLVKLPRNMVCPMCKSGKKYKNCHLPTLGPLLNEKDLPKVENFLFSIGMEEYA